MTALVERRRRSTTMALSAAVIALVVTAVLAVIGGRALWTSTSGDRVEAGPPELTFPDTPTALLVGLDAEGRPASLSILVTRPGGDGGNVVVAPVSIDASGGDGEERLPVAETAALSGLELIESETSIALGVGFDIVELADEARMTELLTPLGPIDVDLPADVTDADGEVVAAAGVAPLEPDEMAAVLTARDPSTPAATQAVAAAAVWDGIAAAAERGTGTASPGTSSATIESSMAALAGGSVDSWLLRTRPPDPGSNTRDVDVVTVDRVEAALIFGTIAPGRASATNPSAAFRVVVAFTPEQLGDRGWTNADVAYQAISQVLFLRGNVLSVDTEPTGAPADTRIEIMQPGLSVGGMDQLFGSIEQVEAEQRIVGVDAQLVLGEGYLDVLDDAVDRGLASVGSASVATTEGD